MGVVDGIYKYYYENGQFWIEKEYKDGLFMNVMCNFDEFGKLRDFGILKDGNGMIKYYIRIGEIYNI